MNLILVCGGFVFCGVGLKMDAMVYLDGVLGLALNE